MNTDWNVMDMTLLETQNALLAAQLGKIKTNLRKAQKKYVAKNREKMNAIQKQYYYLCFLIHHLIYLEYLLIVYHDL